MSRLTIFLFVSMTGCGSVSNNANNVDLAMPGEGDMASAGADLAIAAADLASGGGDTCTAGAACPIASGNGLCKAAACAACADTTDDAACATAYGAGNLCAGGLCVPGNCHSSADCGGKACVANSCAAPCTADVECTDPNTVCNTATGACVTNASCGAAAVGDACPINSADRCCGSGTVTCVVAPDCCTDAQCPNAGDTCQAGSCVASACGTASGTVRYVDSTTSVAKGNGTMACPFKDIGSGVTALGTFGGTVIVKAATSYSAQVVIASPIIVTGSDDAFAECTDDTCADASKWPVVNISQTGAGNPPASFFGNAFQIKAAAPAGVHFMNLYGPDAPNGNDAGTKTSAKAGVLVTDSSGRTKIDNLHVKGFNAGVEVFGTGVATLNEGWCSATTSAACSSTTAATFR